MILRDRPLTDKDDQQCKETTVPLTACSWRVLWRVLDVVWGPAAGSNLITSPLLLFSIALFSNRAATAAHQPLIRTSKPLADPPLLKHTYFADFRTIDFRRMTRDSPECFPPDTCA
jgi:hypothetical protein